MSKADVEAAAAKPQALEIILAGIPAELQAARQWICWDYRWKEKKWTKPPLKLLDGSLASTTDSSTWDDCLGALASAKLKDFSGIGFVFTVGDPWLGIDLDDCRDRETGEIEGWAQKIINHIGSYAEVSPSGTGVKIICRAKLPSGGQRFDAFGVEVYDAARYFTVTGHVCGPKEISDRQAEVDELIADLTAQKEALQKKPVRKPYTPAAGAVTLTDHEVIAKVVHSKQGPKFRDLWEGGLGGMASHSEADASLCNLLAFYCGLDSEARVDDLFRKSGLMRSKWDRDDYRERTIKLAFKGRSDFWAPQEKSKSGKLKDSLASAFASHEEDDNPSAPAVSNYTVPPFPIEAFPEPLQRFCSEIAKGMSCPIDFPAVTMLALAGAAIGNSRNLKVKDGWYEGARFYVALVAPPGSAKSPAVDAVCAPVFKRQTGLSEAWKNAKESWQEQKDFYDNAMKKRAQDGATPVKPGSAPVEPHLYTTDATVEVLSPILQANPRGICLIRDEVTGWVLSMNQYKAGKGSDRQFWLTVWSGGASKTDRKSSLETGSIRVPRPFVNVLGGIQPDMLEMLCDERAREDGFIHRILFCYPDNVPESLWSDEGVSHEAEAFWGNVLGKLFDLEMLEEAGHGRKPMLVSLTVEAKQAWRRWYDEHQRQLIDNDFPDNLRGPWAKMRGYCARIALTVHYLRWAVQELTGEVDDTSEQLTAHVNAGSVIRAAAIIEYFKDHIRRVYQELKTDKADDVAKKVVSWLSRRDGHECNIRQLQQAYHVKKASEGRELIKDLEDRGLVAIVWKDEAKTKIKGMRLKPVEATGNVDRL